MPTRGRQDWAGQALHCFLEQTYPAKELLILDDLDEPSFREAPQFSTVRYHRAERRTLIEKRNVVNDLAKGELIAHFDSDDWSAPERLSAQVGCLVLSGIAVTGFHTLLFYEPSSGGVALYGDGDTTYACGTTLLYRREFWASHLFHKPKLTEYGSDNLFVREAADLKQLVSGDAKHLMVARIHPGNTSPNYFYKFRNRLTLDDLPAGFPR